MKIFISGNPGCGKTTFVKKIAAQFSGSVSGFLTEEIRENGRTGFRVTDIKTGESGVLASIRGAGPCVSKYFVNVAEFEKIALPALNRDADLLIIDEIGKMEMFSAQFEKKLNEILCSEKLVLATLHRAYVSRYEKYGRVFWLTRKNFDENLKKAVAALRSHGCVFL